MMRRLLKAQKNRRPSASRRGLQRRRAALESLEPRRLMALLTNGQGEGQLLVEVNEQGAFGRSPDLAVTRGNRPQGNDVSDAVFNPPGARIAAGTTYESGLAVRIVAPMVPRDFLTAGTIGGSGGNVNGFFLDPSPATPQNNLERHSRFYWPNNIQNPNLNVDPPGALLRFDLRQTLVDLEFQGSQDGTALEQQYTITNISGGTLSFELVRYWDGDLFAGGTPLLDGGGRRIADPLRGVDGVFQTDAATNQFARDQSFHEIQSSPQGVPGTNRWEVGLADGRTGRKNTPTLGDLVGRIINGDDLRDDVIAAAADGDDNNIRDIGTDTDVAVALRQVFTNIANNETVVFTSRTVFGHPPQIPDPPGCPPDCPEFTGRVEGVKYLDSNANGVRDPGERGLEAFVVYLDMNEDGNRDLGEPFEITDENGRYELAVPVGMWHIREDPSRFWTQTEPAAGFHLVDIMNPGDVITDINFGNLPQPASISGVKFNDDNANGVQDANEPGMQGVTIFLDTDDDGVLDTNEPRTATNAQGQYSFNNLEPFGYTVREIVPAGFHQTTPGGDGAYRVVVSAGQDLTGLDFGNRLLRGSITGVKWNDLNGDGVRTPDEPRVPGVIVYLDENNDARFNFGERAAVTNSFGEYEIPDLLPGEYIVREVEPLGNTLTFPAQGFHQVVVFAGLPTPFVDFGNRANFDFGDAPDTYGTLLASNGPRHAISPGFRLGRLIDGEPDGQPTPDATGDDLNGAGFAAPVNFAVGDQPTDVILADVFGGDGIPDLITANRLSGDISVARGFGDGTFGPAVEFDVLNNPVGVFAADFNNDGRLDLAVAHAGSSDVAILLNENETTFAEELETFAAGGAQGDLVVFDFDGDGDLDIIVTRPGTNDVAVLRNVTTTMLEFDPPSADDPPTIFPVQQNPGVIELGRINGDNLSDLVVVNRGSNSVSVLRALAGGGFATAVNYTVGAGPNDVVIADLDDDGDRDLAVANTTSGDVTVLYNNGLGVFPNNLRRTFDVPGSPVSIVAGNFDGRPGVDLAVALQSSNAVAVLSNDGSGRFPAAAVFPTGVGPAAIAAANLDGDNITDLITANFGSDTVSVLTFEGGDEDGVRFGSAFVPGRVATITINASAAGVINAWIDWNSDGRFDAGDQVLRDVSLAAGDNVFFITTPATAVLGDTFARFRFSAQRGLGPTGPAASGEVEDYLVTVAMQDGGGGPNTGHTNLANPEDVDGNGAVNLNDVMAIIVDLRDNGVRNLPPVINPPPPPPFLDVNGNGAVELNDLLRVLNRILVQTPGGANPEPEGEKEPLDELEAALDDIASDVCHAWNEG